jgi:hypothetical protein
MPRLPDHEIIASLQTQVSHLRIQLRNAEELFPAVVKESLTTEMKANADAVIQDFDAAHNKIASLTLLIREIDGWIKNWSPSFTEEEDWQEVQSHIDSALL